MNLLELKNNLTTVVHHGIDRLGAFELDERETCILDENKVLTLLLETLLRKRNILVTISATTYYVGPYLFSTAGTKINSFTLFLYAE